MADVRVVKGQIVDSNAWQQLSDQHGGTLPSPPNVSPDIDPSAPGIKAPDYQQRPVYRYIFDDGSYVDARTSPDGSGYEIVDYKPSDTFTADRRAAESEARKGTAAGGRAEESISAPANQPWIARTGPINEEHPDGIYWTENKNATQGGKKASGQPYKNAAGKWVQGWTDGTFTELPPQAVPFEKAEEGKWEVISDESVIDKTTGQFRKVITERNTATGETRERNASETTIEKPEKPERNEPRYNAKTGRYEVVEYDEQGNPTGVREVQRSGGSSRALPKIDANATLGELGVKYRQALDQIESMDLDDVDKLRAAQRIKDTFDLIAEEATTLISSQQNTLSNLTSQRNTDIQDAASRRTFSANLLDNTFKNVASLAEYAPAGSTAPGRAYQEQLMLGIALAEKLGGLKTFDRIAPGAAAQQTYGTPLPGTQGTPEAQAAQQRAQTAFGGGGGNPITFNINAAPAPAPQPVSVPAFIEQNVPPVPVPAGMRFDSGQLKAPGYTAPPVVQQPQDDETTSWLSRYLG